MSAVANRQLSAVANITRRFDAEIPLKTPKIDLFGHDADGDDGAGSGAANFDNAANFDKSGKGDLFAVPCWVGGSDGIGASLCCAGNSLACTTQRLLSAY